ncbi:MAG: transketolase C-terminal domain-containing protein [Blautia sp.]
MRHGLRERGFSCTLVNARFVKPVDKDLIRAACERITGFL